MVSNSTRVGVPKPKVTTLLGSSGGLSEAGVLRCLRESLYVQHAGTRVNGCARNSAPVRQMPLLCSGLMFVARYVGQLATAILPRQQPRKIYSSCQPFLMFFPMLLTARKAERDQMLCPFQRGFVRFIGHKPQS